ncbi:MAG: hypothetical protein ACRDRS_06385 [Pseudonocardiaceae bacterium]
MRGLGASAGSGSGAGRRSAGATTPAESSGAVAAEALTILRAATKRSSILLVVDYAETRAGLIDLLRSVAGHPEHVRVLLIARSAGDWWSLLGADVPAVRDLVQAYPPMTLSARVDSVGNPAELVREAVPQPCPAGR